eukprot:1188399-Prorocentrum_minimum.AAC.4
MAAAAVIWSKASPTVCMRCGATVRMLRAIARRLGASVRMSRASVWTLRASVWTLRARSAPAEASHRPPLPAGDVVQRAVHQVGPHNLVGKEHALAGEPRHPVRHEHGGRPLEALLGQPARRGAGGGHKGVTRGSQGGHKG